VAEATELLWGVNLANCTPPLERAEVESIVLNLSKKESRKRRLPNGASLAMVPAEPLSMESRAEGLPEPYDLAMAQSEAAIERGRVDLSNAPRWRWTDLDERVGRMMPGGFIVVGALMGNGKTAFLMSQMDWMAAQNIGTLYLPLELNPEDLRRQWAAWRIGLPWEHVARNEWGELPDGSRQRHEDEICRLMENQHVQFPPERRVDIVDLARWVRWGVEKFGARCVIVDHFHRMNFGDNANVYRVMVGEVARALKDLAREFKLTIIASAQLNRVHAVKTLDRYIPPGLDRLKESSALGEEADVVLMLSRRLKKELPAHVLKDVEQGLVSERELAEEGVMVVTCRKHRLSDAGAGDRQTLLRVFDGHVENYTSRSWA
jgi:replicative DNA helicase